MIYVSWMSDCLSALPVRFQGRVFRERDLMPFREKTQQFALQNGIAIGFPKAIGFRNGA